MIGNIYKIFCNPNRKKWAVYHLMPLVEFKTTPHDDAVKCLVLETGDYFELYADVLRGEGKQVG